MVKPFRPRWWGLAVAALASLAVAWPAFAPQGGIETTCLAKGQDSPARAEAFEARLRVTDPKALAAVRERLVRLVWNVPRLPLAPIPDTIASDVDDVAFEHPNLERIDRFTTRLPHGFVANAYHFSARHGHGLAIYHQGHRGSFERYGRETIEGLLSVGFSVVAFDMPMRGLNTWPRWIDVPGIGPVSFFGDSHWLLAILERDGFSPLRLFLDPVLRALNHLTAQNRYDDVVMVGLSGGGWATTVYAALDPRVRKSYPVAGTLPFALQAPDEESSSEGDYEQRHPGLHAIASYIDLYALGAADDGRRQVQILNEHDPCCFPGDRGAAYAAFVSRAVARLGMGGTWRFALDRQAAEHRISPDALAFILKDVRRERDPCSTDAAA